MGRIHKVFLAHAPDCIPCKADRESIRQDIQAAVTEATCEVCKMPIRFWNGNFENDGYWFHIHTVTAWSVGPNAHKAKPEIR